MPTHGVELDDPDAVGHVAGAFKAAVLRGRVGGVGRVVMFLVCRDTGNVSRLPRSRPAAIRRKCVLLVMVVGLKDGRTQPASTCRAAR